MAKKLNGWTKWVIIAITAAIALGGYMVTVRNNTTRIDKVEVKAETIQMDVGDLKKDVFYIREGIDRIEKKMMK